MPILYNRASNLFLCTLRVLSTLFPSTHSSLRTNRANGSTSPFPACHALTTMMAFAWLGRITLTVLAVFAILIATTSSA